MKRVLCLSLLVLALPALARSPYREVAGFGYVSNTGVGRSLYVVGNHADIGSWNPAQSVRLYFTAGNVWTGGVAVQSGTALEYKFISRDDGSGTHCDSNNAQWMDGANLVTQVPAQADAPYAGKTLLYHSGFTNVVLLYASAGGAFTSVPMTRIGQGRSTNEWLYRADGFGEAGESLQFVPWDGGTNYDHAPYSGYGGGDYYTTLDAIFLQDGDVFNYWPPSIVSASRIAETNVGSSYAAIPGRRIRIYTPRGYDQNTWKSYPVLYMHDGNNIFSTNCDVCSWQANTTADKEISQGRMRECIIVGVDNSPNRLAEYGPPGDNIAGTNGIGDQYANFLVHNVRPTIDFHYRTLNDVDNTMTLGSSLGGLISTYLGLQTNIFGKIGPMSPSYWTGPKLVGWIDSNATLGLRIYMDWGTGESSMWDQGWNVYGLFLKDGYAVNRDIVQVVGCGDLHNEAAWAGRLPGAFQFLLDPWDEANRLAHELHPADLTNLISTATGQVATVRFEGLRGITYVLEQSTNLAGEAWLGVATASPVSRPWANIQVSVSNGMPSAVYRISGQ
ncbi:MAG TPA: alpha/beta hydrolase-fold protein [Kiritimatiellia bacterium]|jgi:predicted alpha/beta superfamily hydrolase